MNYLKYLIFAFMICSCAKRGSITGGLKDTIPPSLRSSAPKNYSTDFKGNLIRLNFDEYIKLKNINKQLIVSPPMKYAPEILPTMASREVTINIKDTLQPNTTYSFNFGQSIEDNNESNPYRQFKYVFSTGSYIDSLSLKGVIKDAYNKKPDAFVSVILYEINDQYNDSVVYKGIPRYITNTLDSATTYTLENLKAGRYKLAAIKDENNNFKFDPETDQIGFHRQYVTVPTDTIYELELFKEVLPFKPTKPVQVSGNRILIGYEGIAKAATVNLRKGTENMPVIITKFPKKDSLQIWHTPIKFEGAVKNDSLNLEIILDKFKQQYNVRIKKQKFDTLSLSTNFNGTLPLREKFIITSSTPLVKFDNSKIKIINKDSAAVDFTTDYNVMRQELEVDFKKEPLEKYQISLFPGAVTDYLEHINDTIAFKFDTKNSTDYGNLRLNLQNVRQFPIIIELTNTKGEVVYSEYSEDNNAVEFNLITPASYTIRVIYDENKNKEWDSGSFLQMRQPEEVIYFPKEIDVRANWDVEQLFNLKP